MGNQKKKSTDQLKRERETEALKAEVDKEYEESPPLSKFRPSVSLAIWPGKSLYLVHSDKDHRYPGGCDRIYLQTGMSKAGASYERIARMAYRTRKGVAAKLDETGAETVLMPLPEPWQRKRPEVTEFLMGQIWIIGALCEERDIGFVPVIMPSVRQELTGFAVAPRALLEHVAREMNRGKLSPQYLQRNLNHLDAVVLLGWYEGWPTDYDLEQREKAKEYRRRQNLSRLEGRTGSKAGRGRGARKATTSG